MLHLFDPLRMQHGQHILVHPATEHRLDGTGIADGPQVQVDEEKREDRHKTQGVQRVHPAHQPGRKRRRKPHDQSRENHDHAEDRHDQEKSLLAGIVFPGLRNMLHMPQVTPRGFDPIQILRKNEHARFFPPHPDRQDQRYGKNEPRKVVNEFQTLEPAEQIADKVEGLEHHPQSRNAQKQTGDGHRPVDDPFIAVGDLYVSLFHGYSPPFCSCPSSCGVFGPWMM